ncbi:MAG: single-stranded-DNA-specific exonuclease RecJ, partial [Gammaproteobacteria bacterium]|nr:single-stranded-DNA-specific exonuclease RecJ [Gammaproteobacteria bacterium]
RSQHRAVTSDLGFVVGPRLNAAGRLDDMSVGIECLLATDVAIARRYAAQLDQLNSERKQIEGEMKQDALSIMNQITLEGALPPALCLFDEAWHQGVIGILAARVKEHYHRPVIAFAPGEQGGAFIKGSARSIPGLHIKEVLDAVAQESPDLMTKYGGHAMAAGMTLQKSELSTFEALFVTEVRRCLSDDQLHHRIDTDGALSGSQLNIDLAQLLREAAPWGQGFPEPLFNGLFL